MGPGREGYRKYRYRRRHTVREKEQKNYKKTPLTDNYLVSLQYFNKSPRNTNKASKTRDIYLASAHTIKS